jgi:hypothetical protein
MWKLNHLHLKRPSCIKGSNWEICIHLYNCSAISQCSRKWRGKPISHHLSAISPFMESAHSSSPPTPHIYSYLRIAKNNTGRTCTRIPLLWRVAGQCLPRKSTCASTRRQKRMKPLQKTVSSEALTASFSQQDRGAHSPWYRWALPQLLSQQTQHTCPWLYLPNPPKF